LKPQVILTGASGFTGRVVVEELELKGWRVISVVRTPSGFKNEYLIDFDADDLLCKMSSLPKSDAIIHLASHVDFSSDAKSEDFFETNILAASCLSQLAKTWSAHMIFASGTIVYGDVEYIDSNSSTSPINEYGHAKLLAENIIKSAGIKHTILRVPGIFGYKGPSHLGLNNTITSCVESDQAPILKGTGDAKRNYIYVYDVAYIIRTCLEKEIQGTHLAAGTEVLTIKNMLRCVCDVLLNGALLVEESGSDAKDLVVERSSVLPAGRLFYEALIDIRNNYA